MNDYMSKIIQEAAEKLQVEKDRLLRLRIKERVIGEIDLTQEIQRRFPRIAKEYNSPDQSEHWYWNDGSINGIHLISFYQNIEQNLMGDDGKFNIGFKYL